MSTAAAVRTAILFAALGNISSAMGSRDLLPDASSTPMKIDVNAKIKRASVEQSFEGKLIVGTPTQKASSSACDAVHLMALIAERLPQAERAKLFVYLTSQFKKAAALPAVDADVLAECKTLMNTLRFQKTTTARGAVKFDLA